MTAARYASHCSLCDHPIPDGVDACPEHPCAGRYMVQSEAPPATEPCTHPVKVANAAGEWRCDACKAPLYEKTEEVWAMEPPNAVVWRVSAGGEPQEVAPPEQSPPDAGPALGAGDVATSCDSPEIAAYLAALTPKQRASWERLSVREKEALFCDDCTAAGPCIKHLSPTAEPGARERALERARRKACPVVQLGNNPTPYDAAMRIERRAAWAYEAGRRAVPHRELPAWEDADASERDRWRAGVKSLDEKGAPR